MVQWKPLIESLNIRRGIGKAAGHLKDIYAQLSIFPFIWQANSMWIVKNSTSLLSSLDQLDVRTATSIQTYDFSTLYTSIPQNLLKSRITALVHNSLKRRDGSNRYTHIKIRSGKGYFIDTINPGGGNLYTADQICRMIEFLIDNIFVTFGGCLFVRSLGFQWERIVLPAS